MWIGLSELIYTWNALFDDEKIVRFLFMKMTPSEATVNDEMTQELFKHEQLRDRLIREITAG